MLQVDADVPALMPEPVHAPHASNLLTSISLLHRASNIASPSQNHQASVVHIEKLQALKSFVASSDMHTVTVSDQM